MRLREQPSHKARLRKRRRARAAEDGTVESAATRRFVSSVGGQRRKLLKVSASAHRAALKADRTERLVSFAQKKGGMHVLDQSSSAGVPFATMSMYRPGNDKNSNKKARKEKRRKARKEGEEAAAAVIAEEAEIAAAEADDDAEGAAAAEAGDDADGAAAALVAPT